MCSFLFWMPLQPNQSGQWPGRFGRPSGQVGPVVQPDPFVWSGRSGCLITVIRPAGPVSRSRSVPVPGALLEKRDLLGLEQHARSQGRGQACHVATLSEGLRQARSGCDSKATKRQSSLASAACEDAWMQSREKPCRAYQEGNM